MQPSGSVQTIHAQRGGPVRITVELDLRGGCLPEMLWHQVARQPERPAIVHDGGTVTYARLGGQVAALADRLRALGVRPDDRVGVFAEPSPELITGVWGSVCSGAAYLPLPPDYPDERLRYMCEEAATEVVLCQKHLARRLSELAPAGVTVVVLEDLPTATPPTSARPEVPGLTPGHLAYVIYTSGSTGRPKGVMIEHRSIVNQLRWLRQAHGLDRDRVVLQKTPIGFDAAQWEILSLGCGSTLVVAGPGIHRDPDRIVRTVRRHGVTTLQCVPTLLQALLDTEELDTCDSLTQVFSGGETLSSSLALRCLDALPNCRLVNLYGPTECTINSSAMVVDRAAVDAGPGAVSIGVPVHNTRYHILSGDMTPVAVGEVGELYVAGVQLARGYLGRPDLTAEKFVDNPFSGDGRYPKLYRTGDLAHWNPDGTVQFAGRADNQVKLRGFRVELDEIRLAIENHEWVKSAAVVVRDDPRTGFQNLVAFVQLSPKEAVLMDQGSHGAHHLSKESKLQVKAQLSNLGCRDTAELAGKPVVDLAGGTPTDEQCRTVFARKTYRYYEGGPTTKADILQLLERPTGPVPSRRPETLTGEELGRLLRWFGRYTSPERLLPKYGYASPGSLYATQLYLELHEVLGLAAGHYYYHPVRHQLFLIRRTPSSGRPVMRLHFVGKRRAIEPVYKTNIQEVLEIETGHILGLFDEVLPGHGLGLSGVEWTPDVRDAMECAEEDYYLGSCAVVPAASARVDRPVDLYVQAHPDRVVDLPAGQYRWADGDLVRIADDLVLRKHVVAINQQVYDRSAFGVTVVCPDRDDWLAYVELGRELQRLQMNRVGMGFMSSGYSSRTGRDLPAAKRMESVLRSHDLPTGPSYFFVGGRVSVEQVRSQGMKEDLVHMRGPAEMIRDDLVTFLPDYMVPNRVVILDELPLNTSGKTDLKALQARADQDVRLAERPPVPPRTDLERRIAEIWGRELRRDAMSVEDDFFASGGNSLIAVRLVNRLNAELGSSLPLQVLFDAPTIEKLAQEVARTDGGAASRLVTLNGGGTGSPVFCWPGLGGYPMNLRRLADALAVDRPVVGVQAYGVNAGESPYRTIEEMARADVVAIRAVQPAGPYALCGYSFGARVAFETAYQLEQAGERVSRLYLVAPGSPKVRTRRPTDGPPRWGYGDETYLTILYSVFTGEIAGPGLDDCLDRVTDAEGFVSFVAERVPGLDPDVIRRITGIVALTYEFEYSFEELLRRRIQAPVTVVKARGDDYSFLERVEGYSAAPPTVVELAADHYGLLRDPAVVELAGVLRPGLAVEG